MKGLVVDCLQELVTEKFGKPAWERIARASDTNPGKRYTFNEDVEDPIVMKLFENTCQIGGLSFSQACEAFGDYWVNVYIFTRFPEFYTGINSAKEFLLKLDSVHAAMRQRLPGARPPLQEYRWTSDDTLEISYRSERGLIELFAQTIKGVARRYQDDVAIRQIDKARVEVRFLAGPSAARS